MTGVQQRDLAGDVGQKVMVEAGVVELDGERARRRSKRQGGVVRVDEAGGCGHEFRAEPLEKMVSAAAVVVEVEADLLLDRRRSQRGEQCARELKRIPRVIDDQRRSPDQCRPRSIHTAGRE